MPYIKGVDRHQTTLFPESIEDYITSDNPVRVIDEAKLSDDFLKI